MIAKIKLNIIDFENTNGKITEGSVVFIRSDWSLNWEGYYQTGIPDEYAGVELEALKTCHEDK